MGRAFVFGLSGWLLVVSLLGCATNRQNRWVATGGAVALGAGIGAASAPNNERKELHAVYWGALLGRGLPSSG